MTRHLSLSTVLSLTVHAILLFGLMAAADVEILSKITPILHVTLKNPESTTTVPPNSPDELAEQQPLTIPVMTSTAKATYRLSRHYADEAVLENYVHHGRRRVISASTHDARDESYLAYWRDVVEQQGTQQYRSDAGVREHEGELRVLVAITADGRLAEVRIRSSSGDPVLDNLAISIVKAAAPFKPLPSEMTADTDVLEIIRTWRFTHEGQVGTSDL